MNTKQNSRRCLTFEEECVVCWDAEANVIFAPCFHTACCQTCVHAMSLDDTGVGNESSCPVCRTVITQIHIFKPYTLTCLDDTKIKILVKEFQRPMTAWDLKSTELRSVVHMEGEQFQLVSVGRVLWDTSLLGMNGDMMIHIIENLRGD